MELLGYSHSNGNHNRILNATATKHGIRVPKMTSAARMNLRRDSQPFDLFDLSQPADAYLMGLLQTDGCHSGHPSGRGKITLELASRDLQILVDLQAILPCKSTIRSRERSTNFTDGFKSSGLTICSMEVRRELERLGLPAGRKSSTVAPPAADNLSTRDYVRGLYDGDGSIGFTGRGYPFISFVTKSEPLGRYVIDQIREVTGAVRTFTFNKRDAVANIMISSHAAVQFAEWMYYDGCLAIERKVSAAQAFREWVPTYSRTTKQAWTSDEDIVVLGNTNAEAANLLSRTHSSVSVRRWRLAKIAG